MFPLEGQNPTRHTHFVLWSIISVCTGLFFATLVIGKENVFLQWGYLPASSENVNILTSMFLHGGHWHLIGNMFFLWMFGDNIEDVVGHFLFLLCYVVCGVLATLTYYGFHPDSIIPLIGASGAISGIAGMYLVFFPRVSADIVIFIFRWEINRIKTTAIVAIGCWFAMQVMLGLLIEATPLGEYFRIAFSAHVGGFVAGVALGLIFLRLGYVDRYFQGGKKHWLFGYAI